jgi:3'(2'), 5'-bisphosphate nucleotidase
MIVKDDTVASPLEAAWIPRVCRIAVSGGEAILEVYDSDFSVDHKEDRSPLTEADRRAHAIILAGLTDSDVLPHLPVLSEEGNLPEYAQRSDWETYWLVDPLDGTKEFVKRNGEFTVNIALIHQRRPVLGVVFAPVLDVLYFGAEGYGCYRLDSVLLEPPPDAPPTREGTGHPGPELSPVLRPVVSIGEESVEELMDRSSQIGVAQPRDLSGNPLRVVASRSHLNADTEEFIDGLRMRYGEPELVSRGSSLKLCMVAEGAADIYPRFAPTMEWDTGAGDAVARAAGATLSDADGTAALAYNKEDLHNPYFIARAPWVELPGKPATGASAAGAPGGPKSAAAGPTGDSPAAAAPTDDSPAAAGDAAEKGEAAAGDATAAARAIGAGPTGDSAVAGDSATGEGPAAGSATDGGPATGGSELDRYAADPRVKTDPTGPKMSDMLDEMAAPLTDILGDEEVSYGLGMTAWNLSLLSEGKREAKLRLTVEQEFADVPNLGHAVETVLRRLIDWKLDKHPEVNRLMVRYFFEGEGKDRTLYVVSTVPKSRSRKKSS